MPCLLDLPQRLSALVFMGRLAQDTGKLIPEPQQQQRHAAVEDDLSLILIDDDDHYDDDQFRYP